MPETFPSLRRFGLDDFFLQSYERLDMTGAAIGRVTRADVGGCRIMTERGEVHAGLAPSLSTTPTTGDWVALTSDGRGDRLVSTVLERRTVIARASFRTLTGQVLAANVDSVMVVSSLSNKLRLRRIERLLVIAWQSGALPIVVLTKADVVDDVAGALETVFEIAPGACVHAISALTGEGVPGVLAELAPRTTTVMLGPSGAGKSTLANALCGGKPMMETAEVRPDGKGRHTTATRELLKLANGALLIDTPGLRAIGLVDDADALGDAFSEIESLAQLCRFNDCGHRTEPDCRVREAVSDGTISQERLDSYERLLRDQARIAARHDARLRAERSAERRRLSRDMRSRFVR